MPKILAWFALFLLPVSAHAETALEELARMEQLWRASAVNTYIFEPYFSGAWSHSPPIQVLVKKGRTVWLRYGAGVPGHRAGERVENGATSKLAWLKPTPVTVEAVFAVIRNSLAKDSAAGLVKYDAALGFPVSASFTSEELTDSDFAVGIRSLKAIALTPNLSLERTPEG